jgi:hypothetical protein
MLLWSSQDATAMPDEALVSVIFGGFSHPRCIPTGLRSHASGCELARAFAQFRTPCRKAVTTSGDLPLKRVAYELYSAAPSRYAEHP